MKKSLAGGWLWALMLCGPTMRTLEAAEPPANLDPRNVAWYDKPAQQFVEALPLGNGRLGATVYGAVEPDIIVLNEESMWSGSPFDDNRSDAHKNLAQIRQLLLEGKNPEAEQLVNQTFTCQGAGSGQGSGANVPFGCYQTAGHMRLVFPSQSRELRNYRRWLDLRTGIVEVDYLQGAVNYHRQYFTSAPDQVCVIRLTASQGGCINLRIELARPERSQVATEGDDQLLMTGQLHDGRLGQSGVKYAVRVQVLPTGGQVTVKDQHLEISAADEVLILADVETNYRGTVPRERTIDDPVAKTAEVVQRAAAKTFDALMMRHVADHQLYYNRVQLTLNDGAADSRRRELLPTDQRLAELRQGGSDPSLTVLYFNFGRYLLIGSSRPDTLPANLQGIWAEEVQTPWNGDWHLDINVQMNYWPAEVCNLGDCHMPMLKLIESLQAPGGKTARAYYAADGWVAHVITNGWGFTAPGEVASWGSTVSGSAWLCQHLWEHYAFTRDIDYLRWAYPIMKGSAEFYQDMLIEEPKHGWLVTAPSNSPENMFRLPDGRVASTCLGPTVDMQLLRELFGNCIRAGEILGQDAAFRRELQTARGRLAPDQIGPDGRLQEWLEPYEEPEPTHRHVSHMYGVHPYYEITPNGTPALADAARASLNKRGFEGDVGWSNAWKANLWARLHDARQADWYLQRLIAQNAFPNLFNACWPGRVFQIEGNFGGTAAVAEMLLQSHPRSTEADSEPVLHLLPALPDSWPEGKATGLCARGGYLVDLTWNAGRLIEAIIHSHSGAPCQIVYRGQVQRIEIPVGQDYRFLPASN